MPLQVSGMPKVTSGKVKKQLSEATRRSAARPSTAPEPIAGPLNAVTVVCSIRYQRSTTSAVRRCTCMVVAASRVASSSRSVPAQNADPAPVSTSTSTSASRPTSCSTSSNRASIARSKLLRRCGRFSVIRASRPARSSNTDGSFIRATPR